MLHIPKTHRKFEGLFCVKIEGHKKYVDIPLSAFSLLNIVKLTQEQKVNPFQFNLRELTTNDDSQMEIIPLHELSLAFELEGRCELTLIILCPGYYGYTLHNKFIDVQHMFR